MPLTTEIAPLDSLVRAGLGAWARQHAASEGVDLQTAIDNLNHGCREFRNLNFALAQPVKRRHFSGR